MSKDVVMILTLDENKITLYYGKFSWAQTYRSNLLQFLWDIYNFLSKIRKAFKWSLSFVLHVRLFMPAVTDFHQLFDLRFDQTESDVI